MTEYLPLVSKTDDAHVGQSETTEHERTLIRQKTSTTKPLDDISNPSVFRGEAAKYFDTPM